MSDQFDKTPEARWRLLRDEGSKLLINLVNNDKIATKPDWLDEDRFAKAREVVQKFYVGVQFSSFTGLLLILQLPDGLEPLLSTGNSRDIPALYRRYLATVVHVQSWYDDDVFDPQTKGYKSIRQVRAMHQRVQGLMNQRVEVLDVDGKPRSWLNQYDMALTQFAFIGLAILFPERSGLLGASHQELELINYYWRVLGHLMGLEDQYNACQFDSYADILAFNKIIFRQGYLDWFENYPCEKGLAMTQSICLALSSFMPLMTFNFLADWWADCFYFNGYKPQPLSIRERLINSIASLSFNHLFRYDGARRFFTKLQRSRFDSRLKNKDKIYEKLKAQYGADERHQFTSDRCDYFAKTPAAQASELITSFADQPDADHQPAEKSSAGTQLDDQNNNNNNNNNNEDDATVFTKGVCPFGYGAVQPQAPMQQVA